VWRGGGGGDVFCQGVPVPGPAGCQSVTGGILQGELPLAGLKLHPGVDGNTQQDNTMFVV
jgi:hypothetical protein